MGAVDRRVVLYHQYRYMWQCSLTAPCERKFRHTLVFMYIMVLYL